MIKCPFCHFENEDGALFCERCTSDLTSVAPSAPAPVSAPPPPIPLAPAIPMADAIPLTAAPIPEPFAFGDIPIVAPEPLEPMPMMPIDMPPPGFPGDMLGQPMPLEPMPLAEPEPIAQPMPLEEIAPAPPKAPVPEPLIPQPVMQPPAPEPIQHPAGSGLGSDAQPRLLVQRGQKRNVEYPIYEGLNFIGRADEKPVDIDLEEQEPPDRIWCSRQHACIIWEGDQLSIEDLNSANGTYVNRTRVYPGQKRPLNPNDIVQIGNVQLKVLV